MSATTYSVAALRWLRLIRPSVAIRFYSGSIRLLTPSIIAVALIVGALDRAPTNRVWALTPFWIVATMADEEKADDEVSQESVIEALQSRSKTHLNILFAACASSLILLACLGFTYISLSGQILSATAEPLMEMKNLSGLVGDEYSNLTMAVEFYNHQMSTVETRLDAIDPAVDQEKIQDLRAVLISQEQDFQLFLTSTQEAMDGLSKMVSGSRSWRDDFISKLNLAITTSEARKTALEKVNNPESSATDAVDDKAP